VQAGIYDEFVARSVARAQGRVLGDPLDAMSEQGPQVDRRQFDKVLRYIDAGRRDGATLACGGQREGERGFFVRPTIFTDVRDDMSIAQGGSACVGGRSVGF
jgi:aldehyde dehydrogenase (NAD+)